MSGGVVGRAAELVLLALLLLLLLLLSGGKGYKVCDGVLQDEDGVQHTPGRCAVRGAAAGNQAATTADDMGGGCMRVLGLRSLNCCW